MPRVILTEYHYMHYPSDSCHHQNDNIFQQLNPTIRPIDSINSHSVRSYQSPIEARMSSSDSTLPQSTPTPTPTEAPPTTTGAHPVRRQLEMNRFQNQQKRRQWEQAKEESIEVCRDYVGEFVKCTTGRTFSVIWVCRPHNKWMTKCMKT